MSDEEILRGIAAVARAHLGVRGALSPDTHLLRDLSLDSLARLTLIAELENHFRVCFEEGDEQGVETVADLVQLVARKLGDRYVATASEASGG